jgi:hypothetical protein
MSKWNDPEYVKKQVEKRAVKFDKLCKKQGLQSVITKDTKNKYEDETVQKTITFQNGQVMKISGAIAEEWPVSEYQYKKKGLLF